MALREYREGVWDGIPDCGALPLGPPAVWAGSIDTQVLNCFSASLGSIGHRVPVHLSGRWPRGFLNTHSAHVRYLRSSVEKENLFASIQVVVEPLKLRSRHLQQADTTFLKISRTDPRSRSGHWGELRGSTVAKEVARKIYPLS